MNPTPSPSPSTPRKAALVETTIVLDRRKMADRRQIIEKILEGYDWTYTTSITLLEFKATIIEACIHLYNAFRQVKHFSRVRDAITESKHRQQPLRLHIIHNMLQVCETVPRALADREEVMAEIAAEKLETDIPELYRWFTSTDHVDLVLRDKVNCTRATEPPEKKKVRFETNLPTCRRGRNKQCGVEAVLREHATRVTTALTPLASNADAEQPNQFRKTLNVIERVVADSSADLSHGDCRNAGDCLIAIEASGHATHALSTNKKEWEVVAPMMGMEFVHVTYPKS